MSAAAPRRVGQPIIVLGMVIFVWIGVRSLLWQSPFLEVPGFVTQSIPFAQTNETPQSPPQRLGHLVQPSAAALQPARYEAPTAGFAVVPPPLTPLNLQIINAGNQPLAASHQILFMAAFAYAPLPAVAMAQRTRHPAFLHPWPKHSNAGQAAKPDRWSIDGWAYFRQRSAGVAIAGPVPATYGASQAGAVLRYRLAPNAPRNPLVYLRANHALDGSIQGDLAFGVSARLFPDVPIAAMMEGRVSRTPNSSEMRPAALAVTEINPVELPLDMRGHVYAQAGYVGGTSKSAFADGQVRIDRTIAEFDLGKLRAGAGMWGGAQKGTERLDAGPTASFDLKIGRAPIRVSMDYRHRIAGRAVPQSGVALTLSTGF